MNLSGGPKGYHRWQPRSCYLCGSSWLSRSWMTVTWWASCDIWVSIQAPGSLQPISIGSGRWSNPMDKTANFDRWFQLVFPYVSCSKWFDLTFWIILTADVRFLVQLDLGRFNMIQPSHPRYAWPTSSIKHAPYWPHGAKLVLWKSWSAPCVPSKYGNSRTRMNKNMICRLPQRNITIHEL